MVAWIALALRGGTGRDSMMFILLMAVLVWWLGYTAIWNTVRHQRIWRALLPSGVVLFVNLYYYPGPKLDRLPDDLPAVRVARRRPFVHGAARTPLGEGAHRLQQRCAL